jgi:hypothetical protein
MKYKFYIYRQNKPDAIFNKYDISDYILVSEVTQLVKWGLKITRDSDFYTVIRREFNGEIAIKGEDFNTMIAFEGDMRQYAILIMQQQEGALSEYWRGFFSYFDYKVDLDRCYLSFEPKVWDDYSRLMDQIDLERNILAAETGTGILMDVFDWPTEEVIVSSFAIGYDPNAVWHEYNPTTPPVPNEYYLYSQSTVFECTNCDPSMAYSTITKVYRRDVGYTTSDIVPPPGASWVLAGETTPGVYKWVRPVGNSAYTGYITVFSGIDKFETLDMPPGLSTSLDGCIRLNAVLEYFCTLAGMVYDSDFFEEDPCPMGGTTLKYTCLQQISNLRDTFELATKGMMKFKDLLLWIRNTFNCYWYIDSIGNFKLEHRKYFDLGLSYIAQSAGIIDLGTLYPAQTLKLRRYEWSKPELCRYEKIEIPYSYLTDWIDAEIQYPQGAMISEDIIKYNVGWGTDVSSMIADLENLPKVGWVLINADWVNIGGGVSILKVINTIGAMSGIAFQNARFSQANLTRDLWTWGRLLPDATINGVDTTMDSVEKLRKQVELIIPVCFDEPDFNSIFRTPLGDGFMDSAEIEADTGMIKMQLKYE